jgi:transcriptional regulator with XRE-family HTH domain
MTTRKSYKPFKYAAVSKEVDFYVSVFLTKSRRDRKISQSEVAKKLGVSQGLLCRLEKGSGMSTYVVFKLLQIYDVPFSELYTVIAESFHKAEKDGSND